MKTILSLLVLIGAMACPVFASAAVNHSQSIEGISGALVTKGGSAADISRVTGKKYLFIYFSAHWCPPCRKFTPELVNFYNKNAKNGDFELLFVSSDKSEKAMDEYMTLNSMPWVALKFGHPSVKQLKAKYGVNGIPCLVLLNEKDEVLASSFEAGNYVGPEVALTKYLSLK